MATRDTAALDHVVVLMFENRSFDNVLGRLYEPGEVASFEGVLGKELLNPIPLRVCVAPPAPNPSREFHQVVHHTCTTTEGQLRSTTVTHGYREVSCDLRNTRMCQSASWDDLRSQRRSRRFESAHLHTKVLVRGHVIVDALVARGCKSAKVRGRDVASSMGVASRSHG